jgi:hypothetical protein
VIVERASAGGDKRKITVIGKNERDVDGAIEEINIERVHLPIETHLIEYVCGHNDKNLTFFYDKSGVAQLNVDQDKASGNFSIVAIGTKPAIEDLRTMVQTHLNLYIQQAQRKVVFTE